MEQVIWTVMWTVNINPKKDFFADKSTEVLNMRTEDLMGNVITITKKSNSKLNSLTLLNTYITHNLYDKWEHLLQFNIFCLNYVNSSCYQTFQSVPAGTHHLEWSYLEESMILEEAVLIPRLQALIWRILNSNKMAGFWWQVTLDEVVRGEFPLPFSLTLWPAW